MACITDHYAAAALAIAGTVGWVVDSLSPTIGKPLAIAAVFILMLPPSLALFQIGRVLVPDFVKWWYDETITQRAREYVRYKCAGTGMNVRGAKLSFTFGFVFIFLAQFTASFPTRYSVAAFLLAFIGVAVVGYFVSGNVPLQEAARYKYFRRFQRPSITGTGIGFATAFFQFLLEVGTLAARHLQAI